MGCFVCGHRSIFSARWEVLDDGIDWECHFPSLVALLVVVLLKGGPIGAGWDWKIWLFAMIVNGMWGVGTGLILQGLRRVWR